MTTGTTAKRGCGSQDATIYVQVRVHGSPRLFTAGQNIGEVHWRRDTRSGTVVA